MLIAILERINTLTAEVNRLDGDDAAALDRFLRQVDPAAAGSIAGEDLGRPAVEALPINVTSAMGLVTEIGRAAIIPDVRRPAWPRIYYPLGHSLQMRAELAMRLPGVGGRLVDVLNLESPQPDAFTEAGSHLLQPLAGQAVIAIQEVRLLDALRDSKPYANGSACCARSRCPPSAS